MEEARAGDKRSAAARAQCPAPRALCHSLQGDELHPVEGVADVVVLVLPQRHQQPVRHKLDVLQGTGSSRGWSLYHDDVILTT